MPRREQNCKWYFADQPNTFEDGPNNAMAQNFKDRYASLVRESIQNSLDAVMDKSEPVRMEYTICELRGEDYPEFFVLREHMKGCMDYFHADKNAKEMYTKKLKFFGDKELMSRLGYIRVSDYNTQGMAYKEGDNQNGFYAFVRSAGVSAKSDPTAGGSFGFGKAAYYLISQINTILVSTCTPNYEKFFEGASILCTHTFRGVKKVAEGFYDDQNGKPITEENAIPVRFRRSEPGTDINIMGFDLSETADAVKEMTEAVLRNFWMAILDGKLEVNVNNTVVINKSTIPSLMEEYFNEDKEEKKRQKTYNPLPYFEAVYHAGSSSKFRFYEDTLPILDHVCFFMAKDKSATDTVTYLRAPRMKVYEKKTKTNYGFYGVFFCDSEKGNEILRKMENPAHDEWKPSNIQNAGSLKGMARIALQEIDRFINECITNTFSMKEKTAIDIKGLEDFLYITSADDVDEELEIDTQPEANQGLPTGHVQEEESTYTTDITPGPDNPTLTPKAAPPSTGHVMINKTTNATNTTGGNLRSGHGEAKQKPKAKGIQKPGNAADSRTEDENGEKGIFAVPISIPYRAFSQVESGCVWHYIVLHPNQEIGNVRLHFYAVGEESDEELQVAESNIGNVSGNIIRDVHLEERSIRIKVRFTDNMKHAVKLSAEELHEI